MVLGNNYSIEGKSDHETSEEDISALINEEDGVVEQQLVDADVFEVSQPKRPVYKSIPLKAGVAAVVAFFLLLPVIGVFSGNLLSGGSKKTETAETDAVESEEEKARRLAEEENAELKRQLALQNQSFTAEEMNAEAASSQQADSQTAQNRTQTAQRRPANTASTRTTVATSRPPAAPVRTSTPVRTTRPSVASRPTVQRPPTVSSPSFARRSAAAESLDTARESLDMSRIAAAGSYGELPSTSIAQISSISPARFSEERSAFQSSGTIPVSHRASVSPQIVSTVEISTVRATSQATPDDLTKSEDEGPKRPIPKVMQEEAEFATELALQEGASEAFPQNVSALPSETASYEEEINAIMSAPVFDDALEVDPIDPEILLPGSAAQVEVLNSLTWASDLPRALGSVVLSESLDSDGFEVLPTGTEMIVQIDALSESGAVAMNVVAIVLPGSAEAIPLSIPEGAIAILDTDGGYPVANAESSSEEQLRRIDRQQAMLGALSGVGNYLNRPERETSIFGVNGSSISREFGSGSIWGSILSGAANEMLRSRSNRLEDEASEIMDRPTIWSIEKGRALQIFITQEVAL